MTLPVHQSPAEPGQATKLTAQELRALQQRLQEEQRQAMQVAKLADEEGIKVSMMLSFVTLIAIS